MPKRLRTLVQPLRLVPGEWKRPARRLKACWYAPAGWVAWWRGLLADWLPHCRGLSGVGVSDSG